MLSGFGPERALGAEDIAPPYIEGNLASLARNIQLPPQLGMPEGFDGSPDTSENMAKVVGEFAPHAAAGSTSVGGCLRERAHETIR